MSNLHTTIDCPICKKPLVIIHSRNDMKIFAKCNDFNCPNDKYYDITSKDLALLFYTQYYKENNHVEGEPDADIQS